MYKQSRSAGMYPEGVYLFSGDEAQALEDNRVVCLALFREKRYEYVIFPIIDYAESLSIGRDPHLQQDIYQITDRVSGEQLGLRADITPQAVKLDASRIDQVNRFCYADMVVQAKPIHWKQGRQIMQVGAELFGIDDMSADIEIAELMLLMLHRLGIQGATFDLGHVGFYSALADALVIDADKKEYLLLLLQHKQQPELVELLSAIPIDQRLRTLLTELSFVMGNKTQVVSVISEMIDTLNDQSLQRRLHDVVAQTARLADVVSCFATKLGVRINLHLDLCELRGYGYKSGLLFGIYHHSINHPIALGGRYNHQNQGIIRAATGFSANLHLLSLLQKR